MAISAELIRIVDYSVNQAIDSTMNTDGPLLSFMNMELIDGNRLCMTIRSPQMLRWKG